MMVVLERETFLWLNVHCFDVPVFTSIPSVEFATTGNERKYSDNDRASGEYVVDMAFRVSISTFC